MLAQSSKLINFEEARRRRMSDLYIPGDILQEGEDEPTPSVEDYELLGDRKVIRRVRYKGAPLTDMVAASGRRLKLGRPIQGTTMKRFSGGTSLRQQGKARIMGRLRMIPSGHIPGETTFPMWMGWGNLPQQPMRFPELAGFGDDAESRGAFQIPIGAANPTGGAPVATGFWGNLVSGLTQAGTAIIGVQTARTQASITASQASIAASRAAAQQASASGMIWKYLPLILAVGGGTLILYMVVQKRKQKR